MNYSSLPLIFNLIGVQMAKCEIPECQNQTEFYLCEEHRLQAQDRNYKITNCSGCGMILKIEKKKDIAEKSNIFVENCEYCSFFNRGKK